LGAAKIEDIQNFNEGSADNLALKWLFYVLLQTKLCKKYGMEGFGN
jgi:hypothetical protein